MKDIQKYRGIFPAFYACYGKDGEIDPGAVRKLTAFFIDKGVKGVYVGGSSGECIYQGVAERKLLLENVMEAAGGKLTVIAHVACNNTRTAGNWPATPNRWAWTPSRPSRPSISGFRITPWPNTGTTSAPPPPARTSSSTTSPSWQAWL